jgi:hypothetical protein
MLDLLLRKEERLIATAKLDEISYLQNCTNTCLHCLIYQFRVLDF